jgi:LytR cell envelope-related transcriptional attenuator
VDHPLAAPDALVRPWRLAAFVAGSIAAFELLILLALGGGALLGAISDGLDSAARDRASAPVTKTEKARATPRRPAALTAKPELPRARVVVRVLNGNGRSGAAAEAAARVQRSGYKIGFVGNAARSNFSRSLVMYKPGFAGEAARFARDLRVQNVGPLDGVRPGELGRAHVVFILGP